MRLALAFALIACVIATGCNAGVTESDTAKMRKEFSQANYEKAMIAAGKGAQLQKEKQAAASRGEQ